MANYYRRDDFVQSALGYAIPNVAVTYLVQPGEALATIYADANGTTAIANPQYTDGLGHAEAYMSAGQYTVTYSSPQIQTLTLPDQNVGAVDGGQSVSTFQGTPAGTIDGVNRVFTLTNNGTPLSAAPSQVTVWLNFPLVEGVGFTVTGTAITFTTAPQPASGSTPADTIFAQGVTIS